MCIKVRKPLPKFVLFDVAFWLSQWMQFCLNCLLLRHAYSWMPGLCPSSVTLWGLGHWNTPLYHTETKQVTSVFILTVNNNIYFAHHDTGNSLTESGLSSNTTSPSSPVLTSCTSSFVFNFCMFSRLCISYFVSTQRFKGCFERILQHSGKTPATTAETQALSPLGTSGFVVTPTQHIWPCSATGKPMRDYIILLFWETTLSQWCLLLGWIILNLMHVTAAGWKVQRATLCITEHTWQSTPNSGGNTDTRCWKLAIPNWNATTGGQGKIIKHLGWCDSSVCYARAVQLCTTACVATGTRIPTRWVRIKWQHRFMHRACQI